VTDVIVANRVWNNALGLPAVNVAPGLHVNRHQARSRAVKELATARRRPARAAAVPLD